MTPLPGGRCARGELTPTSTRFVGVEGDVRIERIAALYDQGQTSQFLEMIQRTRALVRRGVNARLALDVLLLNIPVPRESR